MCILDGFVIRDENWLDCGPHGWSEDEVMCVDEVTYMVKTSAHNDSLVMTDS